MIDAEVIGQYHGYPCRYTPTIMDGPVFCWGSFISASRNGVMIHATGIALRGGELAKVLAVIDLASQVSEQLERLGNRSVDPIKKFIAEYTG
jgi:hypothetical protein